MPGKAIYQAILPLCRARVPALLPAKNYWVLTSGKKRGGGPLTDLWSAAINLGEIPELQWTQLQGGLMKASRGALAAATKHVYLCQSVPAWVTPLDFASPASSSSTCLFISSPCIMSFPQCFSVHVSLNRGGNLSPHTCRK